MKLKVEYNISPYCIPGLNPMNRGMTFEIIEGIVLDHHNSNDEPTRDILRSRTHKRKYADLRHIIFYFSYMYLKHMSIDDIGEKYGRDHASVIHGKNKIENLSDSDPHMKDLIKYIGSDLEVYLSPIVKKNYNHVEKIEKLSRHKTVKKDN